MRSVNRIDNEDLLRRRPRPEVDFFDGGFGGVPPEPVVVRDADEEGRRRSIVARGSSESVVVTGSSSVSHYLLRNRNRDMILVTTSPNRPETRSASSTYRVIERSTWPVSGVVRRSKPMPQAP